MVKDAKQPQTYIFQADLIRALAILGVVGIHVLSPIYDRPDFFNGGLWWLSLLLHVLFRVSVPLFIMLSGYLVLGKPVSFQENLERIWRRILLPLICFYLIYQGYMIGAAFFREESYNWWNVLTHLSYGTYSYLYFLVILAYLYFLIPIVQAGWRKSSRPAVQRVILFFFLNAILMTVARYFTLREGEIFNTFTMWILWVGYFLFGYWIRQTPQVLSPWKPVLLFGLSFAVTVGLTYLGLYWHRQGNDWLFIQGQTYAEEYLSLGVVGMALPLFVLLMKFQPPRWLMKKTFLTKSIQLLASLSFSIYLIHPLVLDYLHRFAGVTADNPQMPNLVVYLGVSGGMTLGISLVLAGVLQKFTYLRWLIGRDTRGSYHRVLRYNH